MAKMTNSDFYEYRLPSQWNEYLANGYVLVGNERGEYRHWVSEHWAGWR